ncbi:hypothetical protein L6452_17141 [Arctium lappa]|uniref:Uncharacterized protein n=1 Tax=Arctium lappa TaxID=4217 RepID=A0ACB9C2J6_ARCLA|nr:hypothetical protein L6452_17141 [Arctium lappa]
MTSWAPSDGLPLFLINQMLSGYIMQLVHRRDCNRQLWSRPGLCKMIMGETNQASGEEAIQRMHGSQISELVVHLS